MAEINKTSSVGNTTSLGMNAPRVSSSTGTRYTARRGFSATSTIISKQLARENIRDAITNRDDPKLEKIRKALMKLVVNWSSDYKLRLISEFGDYVLLGKNPTARRINEQVIESIIVNSDQEEINQLMNDVKVVEKQFKETIKEVRQEMRERFIYSTKTLDSLFIRVRGRKSKRGDGYLRNFFRRIRREEEGDRRVINTGLQGRYRGLRKEILAVLNNVFTKIEVAQLAVKMNIDFTETTTRREIYELIAAKVIMYVDLVVRRTGGRQEYGFSKSIIDIEPYNKILQYTSHSYVAGTAGLSQKDLKEIRQKANFAREATRQANYGPLGRGGRRAAERAARNDPSFKGGFSFGNLSRGVDTGMLRDLSTEEMIELAAKYGINYRRNTPVYLIKSALYGKIILQNRRERAIQGRIRRAKERGVMPNPRDISELEQIQAFKRNNEDKFTVPIVEFTTDGSLKTTDVTKAVPVYVMNNFFDNKRKFSKNLKDKGLSDPFSTDPEDSFLNMTDTQIARKERINLWRQLFGAVKKRREQVTAQKNTKLQQKSETYSDFGRDVPIIGFSGTSVPLEELRRVVPVYVVNNQRTVSSSTSSSSTSSTGVGGPYAFEDLMYKRRREGIRDMVWQGKLYEKIFGPNVVQIVPDGGDPEGKALYWHGDYKSDGVTRKYTYEPKLAVNKAIELRIPFHDDRSKMFRGWGAKAKLSSINTIMNTPYTTLHGGAPGTGTSVTGTSSTTGAPGTVDKNKQVLAGPDWMRQFKSQKTPSLTSGGEKVGGALSALGVGGLTSLVSGGLLNFNMLSAAAFGVTAAGAAALAVGAAGLAISYVRDRRIKDNLEIFENYKRMMLALKSTKPNNYVLTEADSANAIANIEKYKVDMTFFRGFISWLLGKNFNIESIVKLSKDEIAKPMSIYNKENSRIGKLFKSTVKVLGMAVPAVASIATLVSASFGGITLGAGALAATGAVAGVGILAGGYLLANNLRKKSRAGRLLNQIDELKSYIKLMANGKLENATQQILDNGIRLQEAGKNASDDLSRFMNWATGVAKIPAMEILLLNPNSLAKLVDKFLSQDSLIKETIRKQKGVIGVGAAAIGGVLAGAALGGLAGAAVGGVVGLGIGFGVAKLASMFSDKGMEKREKKISNKRFQEFKNFKDKMIKPEVARDPDVLKNLNYILALSKTSGTPNWIYKFILWSGPRGNDFEKLYNLSDLELLNEIETFTKATSNARKMKDSFSSIFGKLFKGKDKKAKPEEAEAGKAEVVTTEGLLASVIFPINKLDLLQDLKNGSVMRVFDVSRWIEGVKEEKDKNSKRKMKQTDGSTKEVEFFSPGAEMLGIKKIKVEPATPVYVVNKTLPTDVFAAIKGLIGSIAQILPPPLSGLVTTALNATMNVGGETGTLSDMLNKYATGAKGKTYSKKTHFISGDSLTRKPNPEQVSIDWTKKSFSVKPIPQFAKGGDMSESAPGQVRRMTLSDREKPMSVGISSHLVTYERTLSGVRDNGSKEAVKVFSVNPGITDLVDVAGKNVSLIMLVADMTQRLTNIEGLLSINNEQNRAVVAATATTAANTAKMSSGGGGSGGSSNPFVGSPFIDDLSTILKGG